METPPSALDEQRIADLVSRFYERALKNDSLRPIFEAAITDWDAHHRVARDFWSRTLLGTNRYRGHPYPIHARLPLKPSHFDIWLELFRDTAREILPPDAAEQAITQAELMAKSFKAGMFSFPPNAGQSSWKSAL